MEKDLTQNLDLNHSFDFDIDEEVGGVNQHNEESKATENQISKIPWNTEEKFHQHNIKNMQDLFTEDQVANTISNIKIDTGEMQSNNEDGKNKSKINYDN